jgi:hypothetical protein
MFGATEALWLYITGDCWPFAGKDGDARPNRLIPWLLPSSVQKSPSLIDKSPAVLPPMPNLSSTSRPARSSLHVVAPNNDGESKKRPERDVDSTGGESSMQV